KLPAVYTGIPMLAALSVTHGFLPPHPSPAALVTQFKANMGLTLIYGLIISVPTILAAGWLFGKTLKNIRSTPLETFKPKQLSDAELPGAANSFLSSLLPVLLLIFFTILSFAVSSDSAVFPWISFLNDPAIVMLLSVAVATFTLGIWRGKKMVE